MIGCRVRCKSWIRSHIVAGCFFGKLERFDREFQSCINEIYWKGVKLQLRVDWILATYHTGCCPKLSAHSFNLVGWQEETVASWGNWSVLFLHIHCIKVGKPLRCKSLTCVWQFHCEAVRYMGSGLGRGKWLNHHWFKSILIITCHHVYLVVEDEKKKIPKISPIPIKHPRCLKTTFA